MASFVFWGFTFHPKQSSKFLSPRLQCRLYGRDPKVCPIDAQNRRLCYLHPSQLNHVPPNKHTPSRQVSIEVSESLENNMIQNSKNSDTVKFQGSEFPVLLILIFKCSLVTRGNDAYQCGSERESVRVVYFRLISLI